MGARDGFVRIPGILPRKRPSVWWNRPLPWLS